MQTGNLIVNVYADNISQPVESARVIIQGDNFEQEYNTDSSGKTQTIVLSAPLEIYSEEPQTENIPYSKYDVTVIKEGLQTTTIKGVEILPNETSLQDVYMASVYAEETPPLVEEIPEHVLWGDYPPKIPEAAVKPESEPKLKVLPRVLVPEYVIVHDGIPTNNAAPNYYVSFPDYIKNVASNEIYSTWPTETIKANVHAIISFTLNRIFTEWYPSKGYNFTITSTPQYDQKYVHNRTIFKSISDVVDEIFNTYIKLPTVTQPYFAQYNDGINTNNPGWLSQWGSKDLGDRGYKALDILRYYYPKTLTIQEATQIQGLPSSFPGYTLKLNSCGEEVQKLQIMLNTISGNYPAIPKISPTDGRYNDQTRRAVETFQGVFNLPKTGNVDYSTWYKIVYVYVAVSKMLQRGS